MADEPLEDKVRERLLVCAGSCLDHVRCVKWGNAVSSYVVTDGELSLEVRIEVKCWRKAEEKK